MTGATQAYSSTTLSPPTGTGWKDFTFLPSPLLYLQDTDNVEVLVNWASFATAPCVQQQHTSHGGTNAPRAAGGPACRRLSPDLAQLPMTADFVPVARVKSMPVRLQPIGACLHYKGWK